MILLIQGLLGIYHIAIFRFLEQHYNNEFARYIIYYIINIIIIPGDLIASRNKTDRPF